MNFDVQDVAATVYTTPGCQQCNATKRWMDQVGVKYRSVDLSLPENAGDAGAVKALGYLAAPVVVAGDDHWGGFRPDKINELAKNLGLMGVGSD